MTVAVKNNNKAPLIVPPAVRRKARFKTGQELEFRVSGGVITILPKLPNVDDEYTPEQRRIIDAQLAEGLADIKAGRVRGPFDSAEEMIADLKGRLKSKANRKKKVCCLKQLATTAIAAERFSLKENSRRDALRFIPD